MAAKKRKPAQSGQRSSRRRGDWGNAAENVAEKIREMIFTGIFPAGSLFSEAAVEDHLSGGYSRMPIKEALAKLEFQGLLGIEPKVGSRVRRPDTDELAEAFRARVILESEVVRHLATLPSPNYSAASRELEQIDGLLKELAELRDKETKSTSREIAEREIKRVSFAITEADQGFHAALSNAAGYSRTFTPMLARIRDTWRLITVTWDLDFLRESQEEHKDILSALARGPKAAVEAMCRHLCRAIDRWSIPPYVRDWALRAAQDVLPMESAAPSDRETVTEESRHQKFSMPEAWFSQIEELKCHLQAFQEVIAPMTQKPKAAPQPPHGS